MQRRIDLRAGRGRDQRQGDNDAPQQIANGLGDPVALPHRDERRRRRQRQQCDEHHLGDFRERIGSGPRWVHCVVRRLHGHLQRQRALSFSRQLSAGETDSRTLTATLGASAGQAGTALAELAANGKTLTLQFTIKASVAPTLGSISTPGGIFHGPVGVVLSVVSMKPLNGSALLDHTWSLPSSTFSQLFTSWCTSRPALAMAPVYGGPGRLRPRHHRASR